MFFTQRSCRIDLTDSVGAESNSRCRHDDYLKVQAASEHILVESCLKTISFHFLKTQIPDFELN